MIIKILNNIIALQTVTKQKLTTIQTRDVAEQEFLYDSFPRTFCTKQEMLYDISPMWERPISLSTTNWTTTDTRFKILQVYDLMSSYFNATPSFRSFLKNYAFYRCHACAYVTVTGTINHQGILLVGATPSSEMVWDSTIKGEDVINTLLTGPHALLGANEASSTCVEIPFYVATDFLTMEANQNTDPSIPDLYSQGRNPYAKLVIMCLNPLVAGGSGSTTLTVQVVIKINKLEVYVQTPSDPTFVSPPSLVGESFLGQVVTNTFDRTSDFLKTTSSDFIDAMRSTVRQYTGLHNPNKPDYSDAMFMNNRNRANVVDKPTFFEKMDPYYEFTRITKDSIFHTKQDEMDMNFILSKPQYLGTFQVTTTDAVGKILWIRPISPWQGGSHSGVSISNNIERLYYLTQAWSGDMELVIQSNMTNKQNVKLMVSKIYGLDRRISTQYPDYVTAKSGITSIVEFSGGNQQQIVSLDFLSRNQILYNTIDPYANAMLHGMYYIYVNQPLIVADDTPLTVEFNVYIRCKNNFRYHGYGMRPGYSTYKPRLNIYTPPSLVAESSTQPVMNAPSDGQPLLNREEGTTPIQNVIERMYPIENLRDLTRRMQHTGRFTALIDSIGSYCVALPVASLMGLFPTTMSTQSANQHLMKMFLGVNGGCRLKIRSFDSSNYFIQYYPPTIVSPLSTPGSTVLDLTANSIDYLDSPFININYTNINGAPFLEIPSSWTVDIRAGETGSVVDIHIPHTTMYHWWGGLGWTLENETIAGYRTLVNNMGYLIITGIGTPSSIADFESFMGLDDEARLGFHTQSPVLTIPVFQSAAPINDATYAIPEMIPIGGVARHIKYFQSPSLYYSTLNTAYNTILV